MTIGNIKIDSKEIFERIRSMSPKERFDMASNEDGQHWLSLLTPTQYAEMFPKYFRKQLPDIGIQQALSGGVGAYSGSESSQNTGTSTYSRPSTTYKDGVSRNEPSVGTKTKMTWEDKLYSATNSSPGEKDTRSNLGNLEAPDRLEVDNRGNVNKTQFYQSMYAKISKSKLNGFIPKDGEKYGIDGSPQSWTRYFMRVGAQESNFNVNTTNPKDPGGSFGVFQFGFHYGITKDNWKDPGAQIDAMIGYSTKWVVDGGGYILPPKGADAKRYGGYGGMGAAFGSVRRGEEEKARHYNTVEEVEAGLIESGLGSAANNTSSTDESPNTPGMSSGPTPLTKNPEDAKNTATIYNMSNTPSPSERKKIFQEGGLVVNLDTDWAPKGRPTDPLIVIPDNATKEQREAAQAYVDRMAESINKNLGRNVKGRVRTRSENGRGRANTSHTEPFSVGDESAVKYYTQTEKGRKELAEITKDTLGKIPGVKFSIPHDPDGKYGKKDRGAKGKHGDEVDFAKILMGDMQGMVGGKESYTVEDKPVASLPEGLPKEVYELHSKSSDPEKMRKQIEQLGVERTTKLFEEFKNSGGQEKPSAEEFTAEAVKVVEAYGPGRPGRPDADIRKAASQAAAAVGMKEIKFTSGKGNYISPAGRRRGQKSTVHSTGKAVDVTGFESDEQKLRFIEEMQARGVKGVGVYNNGSVHVDYGGKTATWSWQGIPKDVVEEARARGRKRMIGRPTNEEPEEPTPIRQRGLTSWSGLGDAANNTSSVNEAPAVKSAGESVESTPLSKAPVSVDKPSSTVSPNNKPKTVAEPPRPSGEPKSKPNHGVQGPKPVERKPIGPVSESKVESYDNHTKPGTVTASNKRAYSRSTGISMGDGHFDGSVA